ncbi:hypothetical protein CP973_08855 [Streptomyces albofaciens JCM 4342]|uniref:transposase n=1 Tax=Streptomyces albofaciens TaxID=66866 RepID=UPI00123BC320|nr:hypothetical protein CP973_08855 [Streptomyces albofaciens JCM 4342]
MSTASAMPGDTSPSVRWPAGSRTAMSGARESSSTSSPGIRHGTATHRRGHDSADPSPDVDSDAVSWRKDGWMLVGVAHQYWGALGKRTNCQVPVSVHPVTAAALPSLDARSYRGLGPKTSHAAGCSGCRRAQGTARSDSSPWTPSTVSPTRGLPPCVVLADAAYGTAASSRTALAESDLEHVPTVGAHMSAHSFDTTPGATGRKHANDCRP